VNQSNLSELSGSRVNVRDLSRFSYPLQSDVAAIAVLLQQPGLFLDADTILLPNFDIKNYDPKKLTMYGQDLVAGNHPTCFFFTGLRENALLSAWLEEANERIAGKSNSLLLLRWWLRRRIRGKGIKVPWSFLGNDILDNLLRRNDFSACFELRDAAETGMYSTERIIEAHSEFTRYEDLWFSPQFPVLGVLSTCHDGIISLQNSWHPASFNKKSRSQVLADEALVSRLIAHVLS